MRKKLKIISWLVIVILLVITGCGANGEISPKQTATISAKPSNQSSGREEGSEIEPSALEGETETYLVDGDFEYKIKDGFAEITRYTKWHEKNGPDIVIVPEKIMEFEVKGIGIKAFEDAQEVISVSLPESLEYIDLWAFVGCISLQKVKIPKNARVIGDMVSTVAEPYVLITVDKENPYYSSSQEVIFSKDGTILLKYPDSKAEVKYVVPDTVKKIERGAFGQKNRFLKEVTIPASVLEMPTVNDFYDAYHDQEKDIKLIVDEGSTAEKYAKWCEIEYILNEESLGLEQQSGEFKYVENDNEVTITEYIGNSTDVRIPERISGKDVTRIGPLSFYKGQDLIKTINLPDTIKDIQSNAFTACNKLKSIVIPAKVEHIGNNPMPAYGELTQIEVNQDNQYFTSEDGILYDKDKTSIIAFPAGSYFTRFTVPDSVKSISFESMTFGNGNWSEIVISKNVRKLPRYALMGDAQILVVEEGSAAEEWAKKFGLKYNTY